MKIVIDVDGNTYHKFVSGFANEDDAYLIEQLFKNSTPLPKGHGRLIDADKTLATAWANFYVHEDEWEKKDQNYVPLGRSYDQNGFECCQQTIVNAPTVIEADDEVD